MTKANKPFTAKRGEKALREKRGEYGEPCLVLKNRTCFNEECRLCDVGIGYEQGKIDRELEMKGNSYYNQGVKQGKKDALKDNLFSPYKKAEFRNQIRKQTLEEVIRYINQQKVNYGNKNIFNNQIKFIKALDK